MTSKLPSVVDQYIGRRIRWLRQEEGMSQSDLAFRVGVTFQQIRKYETGASRITVTRLVLIAFVFNKPPGYFFEGLKEFIGRLIGSGLDGATLHDFIDDFITMRPHPDPRVDEVFRDIVADARLDASSSKKPNP